MIRKTRIFILSILVYSIALGASSWNFGRAGQHLMLVYKVLPSISFTISKVEKMKVPVNTNNPFLYSETNEDKSLLKVESRVKFRDDIATNDVYGEIARSIYNAVEYSFGDNGNGNGKFDLKDDSNPENKVVIHGQAYFTDINKTSHNETITCHFNSNVDKGDHAAETTYIDVEFSPSDPIPMGIYTGTLIVRATYIGKDS